MPVHKFHKLKSGFLCLATVVVLAFAGGCKKDSIPPSHTASDSIATVSRLSSGLTDLCKYENLIDSSGNRMFAVCDNGQLKSIGIQGKNLPDYWTFVGKISQLKLIGIQGENLPDYWTFVGMIKEIENGKYEFIISEAYSIDVWGKSQPSPEVLFFDLMFFRKVFQKERTIFLRIYKSLRDTTVQLNEEPIVTIDENIKLARLQKIDIFTSDSIKIPNLCISREDIKVIIRATIIRDFYINLVNNKLIMQFDEFIMEERRFNDDIRIKHHKYIFLLQ